MTTFIICLSLLVISYFTYGKLLDKIFGVKTNVKTPASTSYDGIDYIPMPKWKTFLIQLLNIAGLGPIFGAILGATYGPVAFLWITLGGIFIGAVHDYASGFISMKMSGRSYTEFICRYLGRHTKVVISITILLLMILVGAVFMAGPAGILSNMTSWNYSTWIWIILVYYLVATLLPVDKIIGNIYPIFGAALIFMALAVLYIIITGDYSIPELSFHNFKADPEAFPIMPTMFVTIACGAISGFHATQSPMMARCITNQKQVRGVFFGAMISECIIALIWAAVAMAFFGGVTELGDALAQNSNNAARIIDIITKNELGKIGSILVLIGVVAAPISTGDTAFRSARLIIADSLKIKQTKMWRRIAVCVPIFALGYFITTVEFDILWRYFGWINQALAVAMLWTAALYLGVRRKNYWIALLPALFMTYVVCDYFVISNQFLGLGYWYGVGASVGIMTVFTLIFVRTLRIIREQRRVKYNRF